MLIYRIVLRVPLITLYQVAFWNKMEGGKDIFIYNNG